MRRGDVRGFRGQNWNTSFTDVSEIFDRGFNGSRAPQVLQTMDITTLATSVSIPADLFGICRRGDLEIRDPER